MKLESDDKSGVAGALTKLSTQIFVQALADLPIKSVVISDSLHALTRVLTEPFDLLITSNETPILSGMALIGAIKLSRGKNAKLKSILITSNQSVANHIKRETDADFIIVKNAQLGKNLFDASKLALGIH
jgi:hypothetical protein